MEGCLTDVICRFPKINRSEVRRILTSESNDLEITKSLLNLLHNIVRVGSVPVSPTQKAYFDDHVDQVLDLLSAKNSLAWKKALLEQNISLVINIAASCPTAVGW